MILCLKFVLYIVDLCLSHKSNVFFYLYEVTNNNYTVAAVCVIVMITATFFL